MTAAIIAIAIIAGLFALVWGLCAMSSDSEWGENNTAPPPPPKPTPEMEAALEVRRTSDRVFFLHDELRQARVDADRAARYMEALRDA